MCNKEDMYEIEKWFNCPVNEIEVLNGSIVFLPGSIVRRDPEQRICLGPGCTFQEGALLHAHGGREGGIYLGPVNNLGHYAVVHGHVVTGYDVFFGVRSTIHNVKTGYRVYIGHEAKVFNSEIGNYVEVQECAEIENSIVGNNVRIGDNCEIENAIIEDNVVIEAGVRIYGRRNAKVRIGTGSKLSKACEVYISLNSHSLVDMGKIIENHNEIKKVENLNINPVTDFGKQVWEHNMELAHIAPEIVKKLREKYFSCY